MTDPEKPKTLLESFPELESVPELSYEPIQELNDRHRAIAQMEVMGYQNRQIARELNCHEMTVYRVKASPVYKVYIKDLRKRVEESAPFDIAGYLNSVSKETFQVMTDLMRNAESENVRGSMAKELADRIYPKVTKSEHEETKVIEFGDSVQNLAHALADHMKVDPKKLAGKSDDEIIDLLDEEINKDENLS